MTNTAIKIDFKRLDSMARNVDDARAAMFSSQARRNAALDKLQQLESEWRRLRDDKTSAADAWMFEGGTAPTTSQIATRFGAEKPEMNPIVADVAARIEIATVELSEATAHFSNSNKAYTYVLQLRARCATYARDLGLLPAEKLGWTA